MMWKLKLLTPFLLLLPLYQNVGGQQQVVRFSFQFSFFNDSMTPNTDLTRTDVEGVLCQMQYFFSHVVQNATHSSDIHAKATNITWGYYARKDYPAVLNFTVEFEDKTAPEGFDVNMKHDQILIDDLKNMSQPGFQAIITDWIWKSQPKHNYFENVEKMKYSGHKTAPVTGQLAEASCPETPMPSAMPTMSPAPTGTPGAPTVSPITTQQSNTATKAPGSAPLSDSPVAGPNAASPAPGAPVAGPNAASPAPGAPVAGPKGASPAPGGGNSSGLPPALSGDSAPNEVPVNDAWPFGSSKKTLADVNPMTDFSLDFNMLENHEKPPTIGDINGLMCQIDQYFTDHLRDKLGDKAIQCRAVYVDWIFNAVGTGNNKTDIIVNFTAFATYGDASSTQVGAQQVMDAMKLSTSDINTMKKDYIWKSAPDQKNLFFHTESVAVSSAVGNPKPTKGMITQADCSTAGVTNDGKNGSTGDSSGAANASSLSAMGDGAQQAQIQVSFVVSNIEGIKDPTTIETSGLKQSFPILANEVVRNMTKHVQTRMLRQTRRLNVAAVPSSASITSIKEYVCPSNALKGLTCHSVEAKYDIMMSSDEEKNKVELDTTDKSQTAVDDGTYDSILQRVDPSTPLYIGIMNTEGDIPPGTKKREQNKNHFPWFLLLIVLLLLILCCLICIVCCLRRRNNDTVHDPKTVEYAEREVLVEEFDDEPDRANNNGPPGDGQAWVDDDAAAGVMVPYGISSAPAPAPVHAASGTMVPYEPGRDDAAQRRAIMDG